MIQPGLFPVVLLEQLNIEKVRIVWNVSICLVVSNWSLDAAETKLRAAVRQKRTLISLTNKGGQVLFLARRSIR